MVKYSYSSAPFRTVPIRSEKFISAVGADRCVRPKCIGMCFAVGDCVIIHFLDADDADDADFS